MIAFDSTNPILPTEQKNNIRQEDTRYLYQDGIIPYTEQTVNKARDLSNNTLNQEKEISISDMEASKSAVEYHQERNGRLLTYEQQIDSMNQTIMALSGQLNDVMAQNKALTEMLQSMPGYKLGRTLQKAADKGKNVLEYARSTPGVIAGAFISAGNKIRGAASQALTDMKGAVKDTFDKIGQAYNKGREGFIQSCNNLVAEGIKTVQGITDKFHAFAQECKMEAKRTYNAYQDEKIMAAAAKAQKLAEKMEEREAKKFDLGDERA